jgi:hypothetical protein
MGRRLVYVILTNPFIYERYGATLKNVYRDHKLPWQELDYVSRFWHEDDYESKCKYNYEGLMKKLQRVTEDVMECPCELYKERHRVYSDLFHKMKFGETVFIKYEDEVKLKLESHLEKRLIKNFQINNSMMTINFPTF